MKLSILKGLSSMLKGKSNDSTTTDSCIEQNNANIEMVPDKNEKISIAEEDNTVLVEVSERISDYEILGLNKDWWNKGYIYYSDRDKTFSRIIVVNGLITHTFTLYSNMDIELQKRETVLDGSIYDTRLYCDFYSFTYYENIHDKESSTSPICEYKINSTGELTEKNSYGNSIMPEENVFNKVNNLFEEFKILGNDKITFYLNEFAKRNNILNLILINKIIKY